MQHPRRAATLPPFTNVRARYSACGDRYEIHVHFDRDCARAARRTSRLRADERAAPLGRKLSTHYAAKRRHGHFVDLMA